jgi:hypothetical protein
MGFAWKHSSSTSTVYALLSELQLTPSLLTSLDSECVSVYPVCPLMCNAGEAECEAGEEVPQQADGFRDGYQRTQQHTGIHTSAGTVGGCGRGEWCGGGGLAADVTLVCAVKSGVEGPGRWQPADIHTTAGDRGQGWREGGKGAVAQGRVSGMCAVRVGRQLQ